MTIPTKLVAAVALGIFCWLVTYMTHGPEYVKRLTEAGISDPEGKLMSHSVTFGVLVALAAFVLMIIPNLWRGGLKGINQVSKAAQGKLDS